MLYMCMFFCLLFFFFFQAEDGIRDHCVTGVQTCALPISARGCWSRSLSTWPDPSCASLRKRSIWSERSAPNTSNIVFAAAGAIFPACADRLIRAEVGDGVGTLMKIAAD